MKFTSFKGVASLLIACFAIFFASCNNKPTDAELQKSVDTTLKNNNNYTGVTASVNKGIVTLNGTCQGENCATDIEKKIKQDDNIDSVINNIHESVQETDLTLRTSVEAIISNYPGVEADVAAGVVVLRGSIARDHLAELMDSISALNPAKIDNQMVVK